MIATKLGENHLVHIISFANQKGGVGKTTSAVNCASSLGALGKRVLLLDLDPQGSTTSALGLHKNNLKRTSYDLLLDKCNVFDAILETKFKNLSVIPANISLAGAEIELPLLDRRENQLKKHLSQLEDENKFDYVIIDCPPSLGVLTINALSASKHIIIPMQCEYFALEGLTQLMMSVKTIKNRYNKSLNIAGILITMLNSRYKLSSQVIEELDKYYHDFLFETKISRTISLSEAQSFGVPIYYYSKYSKGSLEYLKVAKEIIFKLEGELL